MAEIQSVERIFDSTPERYDQEKFQPKSYLDPHYVHDPVKMKYQVNAFPEKRIIWIQDSSDGIFSEHSIDSATRIRSVANNYSQHQETNWKNLRKEHFSKINTPATFAFLSALFAINFRFGRPIMIVITIVNVIALAKKWYQTNDAEKQVEGWSQSPVVDAAKEREKAYQEGFCYAYSKNLKKEGGSSGVLHPLEVKTFYQEYFSQFYQRMLTKKADTPLEQLQWIGDFCKMNAISSPLMRYGLGEIPEHLKEVARECDQFIAEIQSSKIPPKDEVDKIYNRAREMILKAELAWKNRPST